MQSEPAWSEPVGAYLLDLRVRGLAEATVRLRGQHVRRLGVELDQGPWTATTVQLADWLAGHRWSAETTRSVRASLRSFYGWAARVGRMSDSPAVGLPSVRTTRRRGRPVTEAAIAAALSAADPHVALMIRLAGELGMRRAEVASVHGDDLVDDGVVGWLLTVVGKGGKERILPVPDRLALELRDHIAAVGGRWAFPARRGRGHLTPRWVGDLVARLLPPGVTMHKLRHRAATRLQRISGGDLLITSELLGHASVSTTQIYVEPDLVRLRGLLERLAVPSGGEPS